jgi:hypothetical protein
VITIEPKTTPEGVPQGELFECNVNVQRESQYEGSSLVPKVTITCTVNVDYQQWLISGKRVRKFELEVRTKNAFFESKK